MTQPRTEPRKRPGPKGLDVDTVVRAMHRYLDRAENTSAMPVSLLAVLRDKAVNVPRTTIDPYLKDPASAPRFDEVRRRVAEIRTSRQAARAIVAEAAQAEKKERVGQPYAAGAGALTNVGAVDELQLAALHEQARAKAIYAMQRFVGRNRRPAHVSDLPLTARELDLALRQLQQVMTTLRPLVDTWNNRPDAHGGDHSGDQNQQSYLPLADRSDSGGEA